MVGPGLMIIRPDSAQYTVFVGRETHMTCAQHCAGIISLARIAGVPVHVAEMPPMGPFSCEVCEVIETAGEPCH